MNTIDKGCMKFAGNSHEDGVIVIGAQRLRDGRPVDGVDQVAVQWEMEDGDPNMAIHSIGMLTSKFGDIHHAYDFFQLAPVPGFKGLTAREVIRVRGGNVLLEALGDMDEIPLN